MKKLVKILTLTLLLAIALTSLTACAPNNDPAKAKNALNKKGYNVFLSLDVYYWLSNTDIALDNVTESFVAIKNAVVSENGYKQAETITILYFKDAGNFFDEGLDADVAWENLKKTITQYENPNGEIESFVVGKSANMIYWGTRAGINATR